VVEYKQLRKLHYGQGFDGFKTQMNAADLDRQELHLREKILSSSFLSLLNIKKEFDAYRREVEGHSSTDFETGGGLPDQSSGFDTGLQSGILCYDKFQEAL